jgi:hypothetical protein
MKFSPFHPKHRHSDWRELIQLVDTMLQGKPSKKEGPQPEVWMLLTCKVFHDTFTDFYDPFARHLPNSDTHRTYGNAR